MHELNSPAIQFSVEALSVCRRVGNYHCDHISGYLVDVSKQWADDIYIRLVVGGEYQINGVLTDGEGHQSICTSQYQR